MRLGAKATLLLAAGYAILIVGFALAVDRWLRSFEEATTNETVRLLAREQAAILSERTYEALLVADGASRARLRERVEDVVLMSEVLSSMTVVDEQGKVVASDRWPAGYPFPVPALLFPARRDIRAEPLTDRPFFRGGDYVVYLPFEGDGRVIGYVRMDFHSDRVADLYGHARRQLLALALAGLAGVVLLGLLLQVQMSRRAATLTRALDETEPYQPTRPRLPGDEFARALAAAARVRRELTEARRTSTRLHQGFGALAKVVKVGVLLLREDRQLDFANARSLELFGVTDVEALRAWWSANVPHEIAPPAGDAPAQAQFIDLQRPDGAGPLRLEVYRQGGGDCDEYLALVHDPQVLDTLETDVRLASQLDGLARTYRTAAHEIRSPLSALMINLDLLRETLEVDDGHEDNVRQRRETYVSVLRKELTRLNRSLAEMLTQTIPAPDSEERFDLRGLVEELGTLLAPQGRRQGVELSTFLPPDDVPMVGYRDRLKQAFLNIAVNALEAMPKGGRVQIEMERRDDRVRVTVRDTGPGIPAELLARIYESDFTTKGGGSGIGLYVARAVVELHGGSIEAHSTVGRGTDVQVDLPSSRATDSRGMPHALIVDDDLSFLLGLAEVVGREGFSTATASSLAQARSEIAKQPPDVLLTDLQLPDGSGLDLLQENAGAGAPEIILITGHASVETAVDALKRGAADYLTKPVDFARVKMVLTNLNRTRELKEEIGSLRTELRKLGRFGPLIGASAPMQKVYDLIARVAKTEATITITGETGTGKELAAQTIHEQSRRHKEPFLPINCGAVSPNLIESELFGHERGSFTGADRVHRGYFERANRGTLFLDEITEMPIELQVKLLRVLETGTVTRIGGSELIRVDVRVISATNRKPEEAVTQGKLREDLLYRLNVFPIDLPPLKDRGDDIELLAEHFLNLLNKGEATAKRWSPSALERLRQHNWPGNVRELRNVVQRAYILAEDEIGPESLPLARGLDERTNSTLAVRVGMSIAEAERRLILATLEGCGGDKKQAAETLKISLKTLYNRLNEYKAV